MTQDAPLRAVIVRAETDTLVVQAGEADVRRFGRSGQDVLMRALSTEPPQPDPRLLCGERLYDRWGRPVCVVDSVVLSSSVSDVTTVGDDFVRYAVSRAPHVDIRGSGLPEWFVRRGGG